MNASLHDENDRRSRDRRTGTYRRATEQPSASNTATRASLERRLSERRTGDRRLTGSSAPPLVCPDCGGAMEHEEVLSWAAPGADTVDTGYCPACARRFCRTRETGRYDALSWPRLCRICREPVGYVWGTGALESVTYRCPSHPNEEWQYRPLTEQWTLRAKHDAAPVAHSLVE
jgi:hypothetical protein